MKTIKLLIILVTVQTFAFEECHELIDDCEYYTCVNKVKSCGKRSYFVNFGRKYCHKFSNKRHKFSTRGKRWIEETKRCLIRNIDQIESSLNCKEYKKEAVRQHVPCYLDSGYCNLSSKDKAIVTKTVLATMWRPSLIRAALKVLSSCKKR